MPSSEESVSDERTDPGQARTERIGYVVKMYPRFSETFIVNEILALESRGLDLDIFSLRPPADGRFHESLSRVHAPVNYLTTHVRAEGLWQRLASAERELPGLVGALPELLELAADDAVSALELAVLVRERGITRLHAHFASVATTVARVAARLSGVSYSFTAHAKDIFHESVEGDELRKRLADAACVVTVSDYNVAHLRDRFGPAAERVQRIYNGLELDRFPYLSPHERPQVIAGVGRLVAKKGFEHLVNAVDELLRRGRNVRLDLVGTGEQEQALAERVERLGIGEHVRFLGPLPQHRVREVIQHAAALAAPCVVAQDGNRDGLPTILLEAMALGTPCVATPVTGIPEMIRDGDTGLLTTEADHTELATQLERLLDDPALRDRLAGNARALIEAECDAAHTSKQLHDLLTTAETAERES